MFFVGVFAGQSENEAIKLVSFDYIDNNLRGYIDDADNLSAGRIDLLLARVAACEKAIESLKGDDRRGFVAFDILPGQTITLSKGCEVVCITNSIVIESGEMCDITDGNLTEIGSLLEIAHSYISVGDTELRATDSNQVTIFIRGEYGNG